jgi:excisionase family DNA binding protein
MLGREEGKNGFDGYLTVAEAASVLGVSPSTLRNWDRRGKLIAVRHPINGYRLYERESLERLLAQLRGRGSRTR